MLPALKFYIHIIVFITVMFYASAALRSGVGCVLGPDLLGVKRVDILSSVLVVRCHIAKRVAPVVLHAVQDANDVFGDKVEEDDIDLVIALHIGTGDRALYVVRHRGVRDGGVNGVISRTGALILGDVSKRALLLSFGCPGVQLGQILSGSSVAGGKDVLILHPAIVDVRNVTLSVQLLFAVISLNRATSARSLSS